MEGSESSINRIGRTIWTVWGYLSGAVGRYLRPEITNEDDQSEHVQQEDAAAKSYKELKENEEEKERSEAQAQSQSERPQSGVSVRTAAAQWEKGKVRREHTGRPARSGVAWSTGVQEGHSVDKKAQERRDNEETSENNNEAARTNELVACADQVCPPASTEGSQDFGVSASDKDVDARRSENETDDMGKSESAEKVKEAVDESAEQGGFRDITEVSVENEPTDDQDKNEINDERTSQMADDLVSQLTSSTRERGDLLNKELKVEETTENKATATLEREVIDVNNVGTKQGAVGTVKDGQHEAGQQLIETETVDIYQSQLDEEQIKFTEEIVQTKHELLEEAVTGQIENTETYEEEPESISKIIGKKTQPAPEREPIDNIEECEARQHLSESRAAETVGISESKLDEDQTEGIETVHKLLEVPVTEQTENAEMYEKAAEPVSKIIEKTPEREIIDAIREGTKQVPADGQHEAGQQFIASETADKLDVHGSMVETRLEERVEAKREPLEEPVTGQVENADVYEEPVSTIIEKKAPEREMIIEEPKQETVGAAQDGQQFSEYKTFDIFESKLDEAQIEIIEERVETKHEPLEEPVTGLMENVEVYEKESVSKIIEKKAPEREMIDEGMKQVAADGQHEAGQQLSEFIASEIADKLDVHVPKLDEAQVKFTEQTFKTKRERLEEPVIGQISPVEVYEKESEAASKLIEKKAALTPEREMVDEETKQVTAEEQHEAGQQLSEFIASEIADKLDVHGSMVETRLGERVEAKREPLEEPLTGQIENAEVYEEEPISLIIEKKAPERDVIIKEPKQETVEAAQDGQQLSESKAFDIFESKLDEAQIEIIEERVETKHEPLEEPVTGLMENVEVYEKESVSKIIEKKAPEREMIDEGMKQVAADGQHEAGQQLSEFIASEIADKLDVHVPKLDEAQVKFTEQTFKTKRERLEEPVIGQISPVEVYEKESEAASKLIEKKAALTPVREMVDEETKQVTAEEQHEAGQQLSEFIASEIADKLDVHGSMVETRLGERVEAKREPLEEPLTGQIENAEVYEEEPISLIIEKRAPERDVIIKEPKQETVEAAQDGQQLSESKAFDIFESNLDEAQIDFPEGIVETKHEPLEEPVTGQIEHVEVYEKEPEPAPERDAIIEEPKQGTVGTVSDEAGQQFSESKPAEIVDVRESKLEDFTEEIVGTECELLEEPVTEQMDNAEPFGQDLEPISKRIENKATPEREAIDEETKQKTGGTVKDGQHGAGQQFSESKAFDIFGSKLDEAQIEFTEEIVETKHESLAEPVIGQIKHVEVYEKEPEPASKINENKAPEREIIDVIDEGAKQVAADGQHEVGQQLSEFTASGIAHKLDVQEPKLDEAQIKFTEETVENKHEPLEEPVIGQIEHAEIYEEEPEPVSKIEKTAPEGGAIIEETMMGQIEHAELYEEDPEPVNRMEKKEPEREAIIEEPKQGTVGAAPDEAGQQFSESKAAEIVDICESKLEDFTEEIVETECELLEEPVAEKMENAELFGQDLEPFSKCIENKETPTPEREAIDVSNEETKQETVGTVKDGQHEAGQQFSESKVAEIVDICDSKLEAQTQFTEEILVTECKPLEEPVTTQMENAEIDEKGPQAICKMDLMVKVTSANEQVDGGTDLSAFIVEADQFKHCKEAVEEEPALKAEVELVDGASHDLIGLQAPELVIKQGSESVDAGPGNQTETTSEFQHIRGEVAVDDVKKSAERSLGQLTVREELGLQETMGQSNLEEESMQEKSEAQVNETQREANSVEREDETSDDEMPRPSLQELDQPEDSFAARAELITNLTVETKAGFTELKVEVPETAESDQATTEVECERAKSEVDAKTESESSPTAVEALETLKTSASVLNEGQVPLSHGEWTSQDRSDVGTEVQIGCSGSSSLPESEPINPQMSEIKRNMQSDTDEAEMQRDPDEAKIGLQDEIKAAVTSLGVVEEVTRGMTQDLKEARSLSSKESDIQTETKEKESDVETSESTALQVHSEFSNNTLEDRKHSQAETMDIESEACGENPQNAGAESVELIAEGEKDGGKADDEAEVDSNANIQERSRPALKRGSEKMTRDVEDESSKSRSWAAPDLLLQQVSSLDCTVQKSKIAVKNPHVRPPKDPRTLINMVSVEPLAPARPPLPGPLKKTHGEVLATPQKVIGFKLPGLGAGFPALRKTEAGKKMRDEGETESPSTQTQTQKSDAQTGPKEDGVKQEQPANKPKWTPPRHPGMGNPLMMSELKSKLKKPGKD